MEKIAHSSLEDFYREMTAKLGKSLEDIFPKGLHKDIGHFNVFDIAQTIERIKILPKCLITDGNIIK